MHTGQSIATAIDNSGNLKQRQIHTEDETVNRREWGQETSRSIYSLNCITTVLPTSACLQRAQTPVTSQKQDQAHHFRHSHSPVKAGLMAMSEGGICACLAIYWTGSNCLVYSLWRISTAGTFSFKVTNAPKQQRTSVIEKRTGALRQVWTEATPADILMYAILPLWFCHVSQTWLCCLVVKNSQSCSSSASGTEAHLLQLVQIHPSPSGTKTQVSPASHHFGIPAPVLGPLKQTWNIALKIAHLPEHSGHATLPSISLLPSLVLWIKFKILAFIFVALYNSSNYCWLIIALTIYLW